MVDLSWNEPGSARTGPGGPRRPAASGEGAPSLLNQSERSLKIQLDGLQTHAPTLERSDVISFRDPG